MDPRSHPRDVVARLAPRAGPGEWVAVNVDHRMGTKPADGQKVVTTKLSRDRVVNVTACVVGL